MRKLPIEYHLAFGSMFGISGLVILLFFTHIVSFTAIMTICGLWMLGIQLIVAWSHALTAESLTRFTQANFVGCVLVFATNIGMFKLGNMFGNMLGGMLNKM